MGTYQKMQKGGNWMNKRRQACLSSRRLLKTTCGFTLIEVMVSLTIMVTAISIVWMSFSNVINATQKGEKMLDQMHHGDFVMEQLVSALRSAAYFNRKPKQFEFWLEDETSGSFDADIVSWVTSSSAFIRIGWMGRCDSMAVSSSLTGPISALPLIRSIRKRDN